MTELTPAQKAQQLIDKHYTIIKNNIVSNSIAHGFYTAAKLCAVAECEELMSSECAECGKWHNFSYHEKVKNEIEKLL